MKNSKYCTLVINALCWFAAYHITLTPLSAETKAKGNESQKKSRNDLVSLEVVISEKKTISDCRVTVNASYAGEGYVTIPGIGFLPMRNMSLRDSSGKLCPFTELGRKTFGQLLRGGSGSVNAIKKDGVKSWSIRLSDYFVLKTGEWSLEIDLSTIQERVGSQVSVVDHFKFTNIKISVSE